jgi:uncharacterized protein (DUF1330 family)
MRYQWTLAFAMLGGFMLGVFAVQGLNAEGTAAAGAYVIVDINQIDDPVTFKTMLPKEPQTITAFGGRFLTRTNYITALDGVAPLRFAIIAFDSVQKAQAWNESAPQSAVNAIRMKSTRSSSYIVEVEGTK